MSFRPTIPLTVVLTLALMLAASSCGQKFTGGAGADPKPAPKPAVTEAAGTPDPLDLLEQRTAESIARLRESAVALEYSAADAPSGTRRVASGIIISNEGDILSVRIDAPSGGSQVIAFDASGHRLPAQWVAADADTGLTLLKIARKTARPAVPSLKGPRLGASVFFIGNPFGLGHSVSRGWISGLNRRLELGPPPRQLGGLIQVDAALHPGDSGALLADLHGGWLGVIRSGLDISTLDKDKEKDRDREKDKEKRSREHDHDLGFAIPARDALWVAAQLRAHKRVDRAYLGVTMLNPPVTDGREPEAEGVVLDRVLDDTPAGRAGLMSGDRLIALNDHPVRTPTDLTDRLDRMPAEADVTLDFLRGAGPNRDRRRLTLRTTRRPPLEANPVKLTSSPAASSKTKVKPKSDDARPASMAPVPGEAAERIERLERRVDEMEKREATLAPHQP